MVAGYMMSCDAVRLHGVCSQTKAFVHYKPSVWSYTIVWEAFNLFYVGGCISEHLTNV